MELISREAVEKLIDKYIEKHDTKKKPLFTAFSYDIDMLPTIESRPNGKWIDNYSARNEDGFWRCSICGREMFLYHSTEKERTEKYPYCHCGADMRGEELYKGNEVTRMVDEVIAEMRGEE